MKIALIYYRIALRGGLETRLFNYTDWFVSQGHDVTIICAKFAEGITLPPTVKIVRLNPGLAPKPFRQWIFSNKVKKILRYSNFDFSLSLGRTAGQHAVLAAANHIGYMKAIKKKRSGVDDKIQIKLDRISFRESKVIFACSDMMKKELIAFYQVPPEKIHILYPPLNTLYFNRKTEGNKDELKRIAGMHPDKLSFVFVSSSHKRKGLPLLEKIFAILKDEPFELIVAGYPQVKFSGSNIRYAGFFRDTSPLYHAADFTIHPATYEPFGQIISESLQCGTPVIVSEMTGAKELIDDSTGVIVDSFEPDIWVETLRKLPQKKFSVPHDFAERNNLTVSQHCEEMLGIWKKRSKGL